MRSFLLLLLSLQIYHCVTLSSAWRWDVLSYTSSLFPAINKLGRLPATSVINSPWFVASKCIALVDGTVHSTQWNHRLRIAISAYTTCIRRPPPLEGFSSEYCRAIWYEKVEWYSYPIVKKLKIFKDSFWHNPRTWRSDGHTHTDTAWRQNALMHSIARQKLAIVDECGPSFSAAGK